MPLSPDVEFNDDPARSRYVSSDGRGTVRQLVTDSELGRVSLSLNRPTATQLEAAQAQIREAGFEPRVESFGESDTRIVVERRAPTTDARGVVTDGARVTDADIPRIVEGLATNVPGAERQSIHYATLSSDEARVVVEAEHGRTGVTPEAAGRVTHSTTEVRTGAVAEANIHSPLSRVTSIREDSRTVGLTDGSTARQVTSDVTLDSPASARVAAESLNQQGIRASVVQERQSTADTGERVMVDTNIVRAEGTAGQVAGALGGDMIPPSIAGEIATRSEAAHPGQAETNQRIAADAESRRAAARASATPPVEAPEPRTTTPDPAVADRAPTTPSTVETPSASTHPTVAAPSPATPPVEAPAATTHPAGAGRAAGAGVEEAAERGGRSVLGRVGQAIGRAADVAGAVGRQIPGVGLAVGAVAAIPGMASAAVQRANGEITTGQMVGAISGEAGNALAGAGGFLTAEAGTQAIRRAQQEAGVPEDLQVGGLTQLGQQVGGAISGAYSPERAADNRARGAAARGNGARRIEGFDEPDSPAIPASVLAQARGVTSTQRTTVTGGETDIPAGTAVTASAARGAERQSEMAAGV